MTTEKQIEANQRNSLKSTGPISALGKAIVSQNAVKHGILSAKISIDEKEKEDYFVFASELYSLLSPSNALESVLVDRIISNSWRLRRIVHIETLTLAQIMKESWNDKTYQAVFIGTTGQSMAILSRYERTLENGLFRALRELHEIKERSNN